MTSICFSPDNQYVACVDISDDHNVYIAKVTDEVGQIKSVQKSGRNKILDTERFVDQQTHYVGVSGIKQLSVFTF